MVFLVWKYKLISIRLGWFFDIKGIFEIYIGRGRPDVVCHLTVASRLRGETDARKIVDRIFEVARACRWGGVNKICLSGILIMNNFNHNLIARKVNNILNTEGTLKKFYIYRQQ